MFSDTVMSIQFPYHLSVSTSPIWAFWLWLTYCVSPLDYCIDKPFNFDLLIPYDFSIASI